MKKYIIIVVLTILAFVVLAGLAFAMAPIPVCFFTSPQVCANVTLSNPLPTGSN